MLEFAPSANAETIPTAMRTSHTVGIARELFLHQVGQVIAGGIAMKHLH